MLVKLCEPLRQRRDLHRLAVLHAARGGLQRARNELQERRFAGAIHAEDAGALARSNAPLNVAEHLTVAKAHTSIEEVHDVLAESGHRHLREFDGVAHRRDILDELIRGLDAELRLRGASRRAAAQPRELLAHEVLALRFGNSRLPVAFNALENVRCVAAFEGLEDAVVHLPGRSAHGIQEPAVVRDDDKATSVLRPAAVEVLGEPRDPLHVEVVRRLVEEDDIPLAAQEPREGNTSLLTTREIAHAGIPVEVACKAADDVAHVRVARPLVLEAIADDGLPDGEVRVNGVALVEHPDRDAAAHRHLAGIRLEATREELQQRGLAVAIAADDADAIALVDADRDGFKDDTGREFEVQRFGAKKMSHPTRVAPRHPARRSSARPEGMLTDAYSRVKPRSRSRSRRSRFVGRPAPRSRMIAAGVSSGLGFGGDLSS